MFPLLLFFLEKTMQHYSDLVEDVNDFIAISRPFAKTLPHQIPQLELLKLCIGLIEEEVNKETLPTLKSLTESYSVEKMAHLLDGIVDSIYVLIWTANMLNLPFDAAWSEVQRKNMAKFPRCRGIGNDIPHSESCGTAGVKIVEIEGEKVDCTYSCIMGRVVTKNLKTGKVVKPDNWTPPDVFTILLAEWEKHLLATDPLYQPLMLSSSNRKRNP